MRRIRFILAIVFVIAMAVGYALRAVAPEEEVDASLYLGEVAPDEEFSGLEGFPPHYKGRKVVAFDSRDVSPGIRGYAGRIRVLLAMDSRGVITGIRILEHKETPNYVHSMVEPSYLRQFLGKNVRDSFAVDDDIDGITRATVSVKALARTVEESSRRVASEVFGLQVRGTAGGGRQGFGWIAYLAFFILSYVLYVLSRTDRRFVKLRDPVLAVSIVIVGLWLSSPFSILHVLNIALGRISSDLLWVSLVTAVFVTVAVSGRFYCGWVCPFGAVSEFLGRLPTTKWDFPVEVDDRWRRAKYVLLCFVFAAVLVTGSPGFGNFETYVTLFSMHGTVLAWAVVALSLAGSLRVRRVWCRFLCPIGALTGVLSRKAVGYPSRRDCPMGNKHNPLISECIRCNRCYRNREAGPGQ